MAVRYKKIQTLAAALLVEHGVKDAPVPIDRIIKSHGINLDISDAPSDLSGYIIRDEATKSVVIGANKTHAPVRRRFTLAHELGHFLLHAGYQLHMDRQNGVRTAFRVNLRPTVAEGTDDEEKEANVFAAELLIPRSFIRKRLENLTQEELNDENGTIQMLADEYNVSVAAMTYRLINIGALRDS